MLADVAEESTTDHTQETQISRVRVAVVTRDSGDRDYRAIRLQTPEAAGCGLGLTMATEGSHGCNPRQWVASRQPYAPWSLSVRTAAKKYILFMK